MNANAGARTPLAGIVTGMLMLVVLTWLTPLFYHLPKAVLGSIVIVAVSGLLDTAEPKRLWKIEAYDDLAALAITFVATLVVGVESGVGIGVGVSLFTLIARAAQTQFVVLGWVPGTSAYHDIKVMEVAQPVPEQVVLRFDADMWFANCLAFKEAVLRELRAYAQQQGQGRGGGAGERSEHDDVEEEGARVHAPPRRLVLDFSGVNYIDSSAMHALQDMVRSARHENPDLEVALAGAKRTCRRRILRELRVVNYGAVRACLAPAEERERGGGGERGSMSPQSRLRSLRVRAEPPGCR